MKREDLEWWLKLSPTLPWQYARTMPKYPHSYVVKDVAKFGLTIEEFDRAVLVIRQFGEPRKFNQWTRIYLTDEASKTRWWTMGDTLGGTTIINKATSSIDYGVQNAPKTSARDPRSHTPAALFFDSLGPVYDSLVVAQEVRNDPVRRLIIRTFGAHAPITLDIGAGTGRLLDLGVTSTALYTAVDPSQGMLNELIRKHHKIKADHVFAETAEVYLSERLTDLPAFELVTALGGTAGYLSPDDIKTLWYIPTALLILEFDLIPPATELAPDYWKAWQVARDLPDVRTFDHDGFQAVVLERG